MFVFFYVDFPVLSTPHVWEKNDHSYRIPYRNDYKCIYACFASSIIYSFSLRVKPKTAFGLLIT